MAQLSAAQVLSYAQAGGFPDSALVEAAAYAGIESDWNPAAVSPTGCVGLWQICGQPVPGDLADPLVNARNAFAKWQAAGGSFSNDWTPYDGGPSNPSWQSYYLQAQAALGHVAADSSTQPPPALALGQQLSTPWWAGSFPVSQLWGPTDFAAEPDGHGYPHWHAGIDTALECGTTITLPHGVAGVARPFLNPGGYGTALRLELAGGVDVILGHLRQVLVAPGQQLQGGEQLAVSNNTGNSTGCHLHFEVRPASGQYGSDIDPTGWLVAPNGESASGPYTSVALLDNPLSGPGDAIGKAIMSFSDVLLGEAQAALGLLVVAAGGLLLVLGRKGGGAGDVLPAAQKLAMARSKGGGGARSRAQGVPGQEGAREARQSALAAERQARQERAEQLHAERLKQQRARTRMIRARARKTGGRVGPRSAAPAEDALYGPRGVPLDTSGWSPEARQMVTEAQRSRLRPNLQR